jgi:hypothetical protein
LIVVVVDGKAGVEAKIVDIATEPAGSGGVKSADGEVRGDRANQPLQPLPHLAGGLIGEGHREDVIRVNSPLEQTGDSVDDDAGLA